MRTETVTNGPFLVLQLISFHYAGDITQLHYYQNSGWLKVTELMGREQIVYCLKVLTSSFHHLSLSVLTVLCISNILFKDVLLS